MFWTPIFCSRSALSMSLTTILKLTTSACVVRHVFFIFLLTCHGQLAAEKEKDQQAEELEEECTVATIAAVADCEAVWKKCVTVVKTADC